MTVRATLWKYKPRQDGTCNVKLYIQSGGKKTYKKTEFHALPKDWDDKRGRLKPNNPLAKKINSILARLEEQEKGKLIGLNSSLIRFVSDYVDDCKSGREDLRPGTWKKFVAHLNRLRNFSTATDRKDISFEDVDQNFYVEFCAWLRTTGCGKSGVANHVKHLKKFMNLGQERGLHNNVAFRAKSFHAEKVRPTDKIYLSKHEIEALAQLNLDRRPGLARERDRFLVSYYLLLRFGDSLRISRGNVIRNGRQLFYRNTAEKTGIVSIVPMKPALLDILERYGFELGGISNQKANQKLKILAAMAGIDTDMATSGEGYLPKSALVTTHTARRSAATNLLLDGVPLPEIMQLGGWKYEQTLKQYLLAGGLQLAAISGERDFFQ